MASTPPLGDRINSVIRNFTRMVLWIALSILSVWFTVWLLTANYVAMKAAFELLGFEMQPLRHDELLGTTFEAFAPDATLAHLVAFVIAGVFGIALFVLFHLLFHLWDLAVQRSEWLAIGDHESAQNIRWQQREAAVALVLVAVTLAPAIWWDLNLFRYRVLAGAAGFDDPQKAVLALENWERQLRTHGHLYAWKLTAIGTWGYLALTLATCFSLEFCLRKVGKCQAQLIAAVFHLFSRERHAYEEMDAEDLEGQEYDAQMGAPAYVAESHGAAASPDGEPEAPMAGAPPDGPAEPDLANATDVDAPLFAPWATPVNDPAQHGAPNVVPAQKPFGGHPQVTAKPPALFRVLGGQHGATVTLADALSQPVEYHVDHDGRIWNRSYYDALHDLPADAEAEPKEAA